VTGGEITRYNEVLEQARVHVMHGLLQVYIVHKLSLSLSLSLSLIHTHTHTIGARARDMYGLKMNRMRTRWAATKLVG
jgi:hypothetical protein